LGRFWGINKMSKQPSNADMAVALQNAGWTVIPPIDRSFCCHERKNMLSYYGRKEATFDWFCVDCKENWTQTFKITTYTSGIGTTLAVIKDRVEEEVKQLDAPKDCASDV
jgi:hypothetical protein